MGGEVHCTRADMGPSGRKELLSSVASAVSEWPQRRETPAEWVGRGLVDRDTVEGKPDHD